MRKIVLSVFTTLLFAVSALAQGQKVTGTVSGPDGQPLIGATVSVIGTTMATITDANGEYEIQVRRDATLEFSYVGMITQAAEVAGRTRINIRLEQDAQRIEDVVVVAYGTTTKESFTGSAAVIKSDKIAQRTVTSVSKAIEGLAPGITTTSGGGQPGSGSSIMIRGVGSINSSTDPLYVVDGIPYDGSIAAINPQDIESMTILKDASAGALYGARGANGVIIITTKKGSTESTNVNFKATMGVASRALPRYDVVNQDEFVELTWEALRNEALYTSGKSMDDAKVYASTQMSANLGGEFYNPYKNKTWDTVIDPATGKVAADAVSAWNEDWMEALTNDAAVRQEYQLGMSGGNAKTQYAMSLGYLDQQGVLITTEFERYSARANVDHKANNWLKFGTNASYALTTSNQSQYSSTQTGNAWYSAQFMAPIYPVYLKNEDGTDALDENGNKQYDYGENGRPKASNFNVIGNLYDNYYRTDMDNSSVRGYMKLGGKDQEMGLLQGLELTFNLGADIVNRRITSYYNPYHGDGLSSNGSIEKYSTRTFSYTTNQLLSYDRTFDMLHVNALVGHEYYNYEYQYLAADRTNVYPGIPELAPAVNVTGNNSYSDVYRIESYLTKLDVDWAEKYYLSASWRTDASSRFYKDNRWGEFWSVGASWRISEEEYLKDIESIDNMTLKVSYGSQGNDAIGKYYAWQSFYDLTWANATNAGAIVSSLENKNVSWETKNTLNAGLAASFFNHVVDMEIEVYNSITKDMLLYRPMAMSTGFSGVYANIGDMQNRGIEATLRLNWLNFRNVRASSTLMLAKNKNSVLRLVEGQDTITSGYQVIKEGYEIYTYYMPKSAGVNPANGEQLYWAYDTWTEKDLVPAEEYVEGQNICDEKLVGEIRKEYITADKSKATASRYYMGSRQPKLQGSFGSEFVVGPFDFSFLTTFSLGGKVYDSVYGGTMSIMYAGDTWNKQALRRWQQPGDITDVPRVMINDGNLGTDRYLIDASYFAIKSLQFGYTLPQSTADRLNVKSLRIFIVADNLKMYNYLNGMDPQYSFYGGQSYTYAPEKTISGGLEINF